MKVTNKTTKTFDILGITEEEVQDLFEIAAMGEDDNGISKSAQATLDKLRQALLAAELTRKGEQNAS